MCIKSYAGTYNDVIAEQYKIYRVLCLALCVLVYKF